MSWLTDLARGDPPGLDLPHGPTLEEIVAANPARRRFLRGGLGLSIGGILGPMSLAGCGGGGGGSGGNAPVPAALDYTVTFTGVARSTADTVIVPTGYRADVIFSAGDPVMPGSAGYSGAPLGVAQADLVAGGNHDGMHLFSLPGVDPRTGGLLAVNHELPEFRVLFAGGAYDAATATADLKRAALSGTGVSIVEIRREADTGAWTINRASTFNRRYSGNTVYNVTGPASDVVGATVVGTLNNCSSGHTPWGTYLTCEESLTNYLDPTRAAAGYGWVVEIDPLDELRGAPAKRTALGRFQHENVAYLAGAGNRVAFYMGDDRGGGCVYKFVPARAYDTTNRQANATLLDEGALFAARFNADGTGDWLPLVSGQSGLSATQSQILVDTLPSALAAGATAMDRPEWITVAPDGAVYVSLTNNAGRTTTDAANPRAANLHGHVVRFFESSGNPVATQFAWEVFLLAGDPSLAADNLVGNLVGDTFSSPDGIRVDPQGRLWILTDASGGSGAAGRTVADVFGNNAMFHVDRSTRRSTRFLVGPVGCEITGIAYNGDLTAMFVNIQHPSGAWPVAGQIPRSSTLAIRRIDGRPIGT